MLLLRGVSLPDELFKLPALLLGDRDDGLDDELVELGLDMPDEPAIPLVVMVMLAVCDDDDVDEPLVNC